MIENIRLSIKGIISHKMRSVLTMLGIIIGIASIITIVSIIQGATSSLKNDFVGDSSNTVTLGVYARGDSYSPYNVYTEGALDGFPSISDDSMEKISQLEGVVSASKMYYNEYNFNVSRNEKSEECSTYGVAKDFFGTKGLDLVSGRLFDDHDFEKKHNVIVLSSELASTLFPNENSVGKTVVLNEEMFVVVGVVTAEKDYAKIEDMNDYISQMGFASPGVYVPMTSWNVVGGYDDIEQLVVKFDNIDNIVDVATKAAAVLNEQVWNADYEYKAGSLNESANELQTITQIATLLLVGIASISLFVGGIGVMNIMLVSVTERTKEIGLKKALGAKRRVILSQFLTESVVLTSLGGFLGVIIGIALAYLIGLIAGMDVIISSTAILVSVGFSMFVGIVFGLVPSIRASKLDPIEALRYE